MSEENKKCVLSLLIGGAVLSPNDNMVGEY
jgi:hypothetical protein